MPNRKLLLCTLFLVASPWAATQTVWRCGSNYSQQPCAGGSALATPTAPSPADAAHAAGAAKADAKRADEMEKARLIAEKNAPKAVVIGAAEKPEGKKVAATGKKKKPAKSEDFTAVAPGSGKKKK